MSALLLVANLVWHGLAVYWFAFRTEHLIATMTFERPVAPMAIRAMIFLGALNAAVLLPGLVALFVLVQPTWLIPSFYTATNLSQFAYDLVIHRAGVTRPVFVRTILLGDGVFAVLNAGWVLS